ncbi:MAG: plasmid pRiA4b ORF-3 family protein [Saprospiraceae bacterium]|nr:plasmid pRiA4b ORF-3 family protein [Saprospiraceae bacterium]
MRVFFQLKINLEGIKPAIWRSFVVDGETTLSNLHTIIQIAMGWQDEHLWAFETLEGSYGPSNSIWDDSKKEATKHNVKEILKIEKDTVKYIYDFGDYWQHKVELEKILTPEEVKIVPICLAGQGHCPPEDCGGIWGYSEILEDLSDPDTPAFQEVTNRLGKGFDPNFFDLNKINQILKQKLETNISS